MFRCFSLFVVLILAGCAGQGMNIAPYQDKEDAPHSFHVCHGFSCTARTETGFTAKQWKKIIAGFSKKPRTPEKERLVIAHAIGQMEAQVLENTKMNPDQGEAHTFEKDQDQMDCIDEAINTSLYLKFLDEADVLKFHDAHDPVHRGFLVDGMWPHNSGAVEEKATGDIYVVDSYYFDAGQSASVVPLDEWLDEWRPEGID